MNQNKITIMDPLFPQVCYQVSEQELLTMIECSDYPEWWKSLYKNHLEKLWKEEKNKVSNQCYKYFYT
jgi:hypothetical protein